MALALMMIAAYALKSYTAFRTAIGSLLNMEGGMVMKPKWGASDLAIDSVAWTMAGPTIAFPPS